MKKILLYIVFFGTPILSFAQNDNIVKGTVSSQENGEPVPGATITIKGTNCHCITDQKGCFTIQVPKGANKVQVRFLGMKDEELNIVPGMKIYLQTDSKQINDVVVVAYGSAMRKDLTSSIGKIAGEKVLTVPITSLEQTLQGKIPGVEVMSATGAPGGAVIVNVRGTSSITAGNSPLYVVDGLPIISDDMTLKGGYQGNGASGIADINPNDVESIEVLKDASAAALYGSRASNGVVLITTKKGYGHKPTITLNSYIGIQDFWKKLKYLNASDYVNAMNEAIDNYNSSYNLTETQAAFKKHISPVVDGVNTNWVDEITRNVALQTSHQLSIGGSTDRGAYYLSGGYYYQQGILKKTDYRRFNLRSNVSYRLNRRIDISANIALSSSNNNRSTGDNNIYSPWICAQSTTPDQPIYDGNGNYYTTNVNNPVHLINEQEQNSKHYRGILNFKTNVIILKDLTYHFNYGGDFNIEHDFGYFPKNSIEGASSKGESSDYRGFTYTNLYENTIDYKHDFGHLKLKALVGTSYQHTSIDDASVTGINFISTTLKYIAAAGTISDGSSSLEENALLSFFGRLNLNYKDKYYFEGSLRSDASSKFKRGKRVGYFPATSFGWNINKEHFFPENSVVNELKLRGSIGLTGNQEGIGNYNYQQTYSASQIKYNNQPGLAFTYSKANSELTWEKTLQWGFGVDFGIFNNRIEGTLDWYKKDTHDLLLSHSINSLSGYSSMISNVGSITNSGWEFQITSHNCTRNFLWNTTLNITFEHNKVTGLNKDANGNNESVDVGYVNRLQVGEPMAAFYLVKMAGIYQSKEEILSQPHGQELYDAGIRPGDVKYEDLNKDGIIDDNDRQFCGSPFPKFFGSIINEFKYKGFDLSFGLQFSFGSKLYAYWKSSNKVANLGGYNSQILESEWENRWTDGNHSNSTPRAVASGYSYKNNTLESTRYLENNDFLRIRNLTIGYTLPEGITDKLEIQKVRFYVTAENLYTFTSYDGYDPEVAIFPNRTTYRGTDAGSVPQLRSFVFGVNVGF
jgi:TonB-linked SusC/RagA family outer membrane protein